MYHISFPLLHKAGEALAHLKYEKKCPKSDLIRFDRIVIVLHVAVCLVFVCPTRSGRLRNQRFYYWGWFTKTGSLAQWKTQEQVWQEALGSHQEDFEGPLHLLVASEKGHCVCIVSECSDTKTGALAQVPEPSLCCVAPLS